MHDSITPESGFSIPWVHHVIQKVQSLRFGSVQIKIHDGHVVVVEATEQTRFNPPKNSETEKFLLKERRAKPSKQ